ncbi:hypothetical protein NEOLEDRAFT_1130041 [Neolentinus lepideus HHB14362 ss-1]|uniref:Uncharacterized protein n=1 Tax=Neolentinus lepideus HHB14362 ss-1 TaxID=1314782 RepID=A0A165UFM2_9AGAM|nr:hypothetical protein NEOLEDRAFT_1130041 [Neolentinus lepideus HHB14362 ss-1]
MVECLQRGFPGHLDNILMRYGPEPCDAYLTVHSIRDHTQAIAQNAQDHDFHKPEDRRPHRHDNRVMHGGWRVPD